MCTSNNFLAIYKTILSLKFTGGKNLNDDDNVSSLKLPAVGAQLYLRDLGPQISWKNVLNGLNINNYYVPNKLIGDVI